MVLGAYRDLEAKRPGHLREALTELARQSRPITLRGLDREGVGGLLERLSERVPSEERVASIHDITEGNPLFVQELVHTLRPEALDSPDRITVPVPESIRAVIDKRLAPLSADAVQVLSAAAVVGRAFDLSLLGAACDLPMQQVLGALSEATDLGVVTEEPGTIGLYRFSHPLMREVVYERLPLPARVELHRRVGEAIETRYGKATGPWRRMPTRRPPGSTSGRSESWSSRGPTSQQDSPLRARLLARLSLELTFSEGMERRDFLSRQAVAMAGRVGDPSARSGALRARWMAVWGAGRAR